MTNNQSDTPTPSCYATFRDGKMDYSEFCVSENLGDFDVSELDADIDIVPLYSEAIVSELLAALSAERAKNAKLREEVLEEAAKAVEGEICGCCWDDDAQAFAEHAAETLRAMKEKQ